ncbi:MAG: hypothetical protein EPO64_04440 [Nitrospirae bacterium]|nr:MAG: hypothetical protein EPO64_04440 [Nitrospirota bacterium]
MKLCDACGQEPSLSDRFCTHCGKPVAGPSSMPSAPPGGSPEAEEMNLPVLYLMIAFLILAGLFPPWETAPGQPPEFLGFHFILNPPDAASTGQGSGVISRLLITVELVTIAIAGFYFSWLFRKRADGK